jgi:hypothetical protein
MKTYRDFPQRLYHRVPHWVEPGALLHIRIRLDLAKPKREFTNPSLGQANLGSAISYEGKKPHSLANALRTTRSTLATQRVSTVPYILIEILLWHFRIAI